MKASRFIPLFFSLCLFHLGSFSVYSQPDLTTGSFTNFSASAGEGGTFLATYFSITNQGTAFADSSWVGFYISKDNLLSTDDILLGETRVASLPVGEFAYMGGNSLQLPATVLAGNYWIIYVYDSRKNIAESNENNNIEVQKLSIQPPVFDFSLELKPDVIYASFPIGISQAITLRCINNGNAQAPMAPITIYISADQAIDANDTKLVDYLPQGSSIDKSSSVFATIPLTIPTTTSEGSAYLIFVVDDKNQYAEGSESNNRIIKSVTFKKPMVDLRVTGVAPWKDTLTTGIYRNFGFHYIDNKGNVTAKNTSYTISISKDTIPDASDILIKSGTIDSLGINDERTGFYFDGFVPSTLAKGSYYYLFKLELQNGYPEANSKDNVLKQKLYIRTDSISIPGYLVETGTLTQNDCFANPLSVKSCDKKIVYTSSYAGTKYNHTCYFQGIIEILSEGGQGLNIVFDKFNVSQDTISIYEDTKLIGTYTGTTNPGSLYSKKGVFRIVRMNHPFVPMPNSGYGFSVRSVCGEPLGIQLKKKVTTNNLCLFPNPSHSVVNVRLPEEKGKLQIMDILGQVVLSYEEAPQQFDAQILKKGTYTVKWSTETYFMSTMLIVE